MGFPKAAPFAKKAPKGAKPAMPMKGKMPAKMPAMPMAPRGKK